MSNLVQNRSMPPNTIIPIVEYDNIEEAIVWLTNNFGFTERWRAGNHRAQISFEGGTIVIIPQRGEVATVQSLIVRVNDIEHHYTHAKKQGVIIIQEPMDFPYGERQYTAQDLCKHSWTFSQSINDVAPEAWGGTTFKVS